MPATSDLLNDTFERGLPFDDFVALGEPEGHRPAWDQRYAQCALAPEQRRLVESFVRPMKVLCLTGTWCGDCALQGAAMQRVAEAGPLIDLRFVLRGEAHAELVVKNPINAGFRVPITWWLAEDGYPVHRFGDRTLSRYPRWRERLWASARTCRRRPPRTRCVRCCARCSMSSSGFTCCFA